MVVSSILLSRNGCYVDEDGNLPPRPSFDKAFLAALVRGQHISDSAYLMLPSSMRDTTFSATNAGVEPEIGITIPEIAGLTDLLIVVRNSQNLSSGKKFRLDAFDLIVSFEHIEIYRRKQ